MRMSNWLVRGAMKLGQMMVALIVFVAPAQAIVIENFDSPLDSLYFSFSDIGPIAFAQTTSADAGIAAPTGQSTSDPILSFDVPDAVFAGVGRNFYDTLGTGYAGSQDWSVASGVQFWLYGSGLGTTMRLSLLDTDSTFAGELWLNDFVDDQTGWRLVELSFSDFYNAPYSVINDNVFNLDTIYSWALLGVDGVSAGTYYIEDIELTPVPAPASFLLLVMGLLSLALSRRSVPRR